MLGTRNLIVGLDYLNPKSQITMEPGNFIVVLNICSNDLVYSVSAILNRSTNG